MQVVKIVVWEENGAWIGYLQDYPDYWTQGDSLGDLKEHLNELYADLSTGVDSRRSASRASGDIMKRIDLVKTIERFGFAIVRHGAKHDGYRNPGTGVSQPVPLGNRSAEMASSSKQLVTARPYCCDLRTTLRRQGIEVNTTDLMIASVALDYDFTMVTQNTRDFS